MTKQSWLVLGLAMLVSGARAEVTGVIVDATALDVQRCRFPRLYDPEGRMVYPTTKLCSDPNYLQGFAGYKGGLESARADRRRVGDSPLVIRPTALHDADRTGGSMDISAEQASQLRDANHDHGILDRDRVAVVVGLSVLKSTPEVGAKDVAADSLLCLVFSKHLRRDILKTEGLIKLVDDKGQPVGGEVVHNWNERTIEVRPAAPLAPGAKYKLVVAKKIEADTRATLEADFIVEFTIKSPPQGTDAKPVDDKKPEG